MNKRQVIIIKYRKSKQEKKHLIWRMSKSITVYLTINGIMVGNFNKHSKMHAAAVTSTLTAVIKSA